MKRITILIVLMFYTLVISAQSRFDKVTTTEFKSLSTEEMLLPLMYMQKKHENNQQRIDNLIDWVLELKTQTTEKQFLEEMDVAYKGLRSFDNEGLALNGMTEKIRTVEQYIKKSISDYNIRIQSPEQSKHQKTSEEYYKKAQESDDLQSAFENINKFIDLEPNSSDGYFSRGFMYLYGYGNNDKAIEDFTKSIQLRHTGNNSYFHRGMAYHYLGKSIDAIKDFTYTINADTENTDAYFMRGMLKSNLGDRMGAISDYDEILKREKTAEPKFYIMATVYNNKAYCLIELGKYDEALPFINKALNLNKGISYIWDTRGELYYHKGEYNKCINDMTKSINITTGEIAHYNSYYYRGLAKIKLGKKQEGCMDLSKAGELGKEEAYKAISEYCK